MHRLLFSLLVMLVMISGCSKHSSIVLEPSELSLPVQQTSYTFGELVNTVSSWLAVEDDTMHRDLEYWQSVNNDVCAMIAIPDYDLYYPVVQATESNNQWLRTDIYGNPATSGCVFLDVRCNMETIPVKLVHGHNMRDGSMFASLPNYLTLSDCSEAPLIELYIEDGLLIYQVFAVLSVNSKEEALPVDALATSDTLDSMISELIDRSVVPGGTCTSYDLLALNTCWYGQSGKERNLHCVVIASRI